MKSTAPPPTQVTYTRPPQAHQWHGWFTYHSSLASTRCQEFSYLRAPRWIIAPCFCPQWVGRSTIPVCPVLRGFPRLGALGFKTDAVKGKGDKLWSLYKEPSRRHLPWLFVFLEGGLYPCPQRSFPCVCFHVQDLEAEHFWARQDSRSCPNQALLLLGDHRVDLGFDRLKAKWWIWNTVLWDRGHAGMQDGNLELRFHCFLGQSTFVHGNSD